MAPGFKYVVFNLLLFACLVNPGQMYAQNGEHLLWYDEPASEWVEALPVGNSRLGAMVFGGVHKERLQLNEESIWTGQPVDREKPDAGTHLPKVRELLFQGEYEKAETMVAEKMMGKRIQGHSYQMLGNLIMYFEHGEDAEIEDYQRSLNLKKALATVSYTADGVEYKREVFSSPVDEVLIVRIISGKPGMITMSAGLSRPKDAEIEVSDQGAITMEGQVTGGGADVQGKHPGVHYHSLLRMEHKGGELSARGDSLQVRQADTVTMYLTARTDYWGEDPADWCQKVMDKATGKSYSGIKSDHIQEHQRLYGRSELELDGSNFNRVPTDERLNAVKEGGTDRGLVELYYHYGRYLLISSSRRNDLPANLQGLWADGLTPPWHADYHININIQMNYWPAEVTNLAETHHPFFNLIDSLRPRGRITAQNTYNSRGFVAHHTTDVWHWTTPIGEPQWGMWPMSVAWSCRQLWEHYRFNQDTTFLREKAYPIMKDASLFFVDYLTEHPETGYLVSGPSNSPENRFRTEDGQVAHISMAPTMDIQIINELLSHTIKAGRVLNKDEAYRDTLQHIKQKLRPIEIGDDGRILEWRKDFEEVDPGHRHISHLYALYPGDAISTRETPMLAEAAGKTIDYRLEHGGGHTGWSRAWIINFFARLKDAERAHENVLALFRKSTLPNLFDTHPPFQIDGNFGGTAGIAEMLIQSHQGEIELLPALPKAWEDGKVSGLKARGDYELSFSWADGSIVEGSIKVNNEGPCRIRADRKVSIFKDGSEIEVKHVAPNVVEFYGRRGETYTFK